MTLSGVGAHHQNGIAERAIATVVSRARTMMLHAALHWPEMADTALWPMAMTYSAYLWNITPKQESGMSPLELFTGTKQLHPILHNTHVWGCPAYVLDPALQDGKKLPKWKPRSRRGMFVGYSRNFAASVGEILNLTTKNISPQFHVVYDDWFTTTYTDGNVEPAVWSDLVTYHREWVLIENGASVELPEEWLDETELAQRREQERQESVASLRSNPRASDTSPSPTAISSGGRTLPKTTEELMQRGN